MRKYGLEKFSFEVIEECAQEDLNLRERYWIKYYNSNDMDYGYNLTIGGDAAASSTKKLTEEQVLKIKDFLLSGKRQEAIAKDFNVSQSVISYINRGLEYNHEDWTYPIVDRRKRCKKCGVLITCCSKYCKKCQEENRRKIERPTREELKRLIREKPFTQIGKMFGITDNAIKKWCISENLPSRKTDINKISDEDWELI